MSVSFHVAQFIFLHTLLSRLRRLSLARHHLSRPFISPSLPFSLSSLPYTIHRAACAHHFYSHQLSPSLSYMCSISSLINPHSVAFSALSHRLTSSSPNFSTTLHPLLLSFRYTLLSNERIKITTTNQRLRYAFPFHLRVME